MLAQQKMTDSDKILLHAICFVTSLVILISVVYVGKLYNDVDSMYVELMSDAKDFRITANDAWSTIMESLDVSHPFEVAIDEKARVKRSAECMCAYQPNDCPPGLPGPPGYPGEAGEDGLPGVIGLPGVDGIVIAAQRSRGTLCHPCPPGPPGRKGPMGPVGLQGPDGLPGQDGLPGWDGQPGLRGPPGEHGFRGAPGIPGEPGLPGRNAISGIRRFVPGPPGPRGLPGAPGRPGMVGRPGRPGAPGLVGREGRDGEPGQSGEMGEQGEAGVPGMDVGYCQCPPRTHVNVEPSKITEEVQYGDRKKIMSRL